MKRLVRPYFAGERKFVLADIERDNAGAGQFSKQLDRDVTQPAGTDDDRGGGSGELRQHPLDGVIGSEPGVGRPSTGSYSNRQA